VVGICHPHHDDDAARIIIEGGGMDEELRSTIIEADLTAIAIPFIAREQGRPLGELVSVTPPWAVRRISWTL